LFFIPSDPNHISFFDIYSRTVLMFILLPGVLPHLRDYTPGYQDFATTWLNPGIALVLASSTHFIMRFIASPFLRFFVSPSARPRAVHSPLSTLSFQLSTFNFQLSAFNSPLSTFSFQLSTFHFQFSTFHSPLPISHLALPLLP
jgi:hypothetical protein